MKFSIRDLLLVTVIVALAVGWWVDHRFQVAAVKDNAAAAAANAEAAEQWQQISEMAEQRHETTLRSLGFTIEKDGSKTTVTLPPSLPISSAPAPNPPKP